MLPKFVSKKVSKVRFKPINSSFVYKPDAFVTGSWDDSENCVSVWRIIEDTIDTSLTLLEPKLQSVCDFNGDVTELEYLNETFLVAGSSNGDVVMFGHEGDGLFMKQKWKTLHNVKGSPFSVSGIATCGNKIATVGEGGQLTLLDPSNPQPVYNVVDADSYSFTSVCFTNPDTILTGNITGQVKQYDLRSEPKIPRFKLDGDNSKGSVMCLAKHPAQHHVIASGGETGKISLCDLRSEKAFFTNLLTHKSAVNEIKFHPLHHNHMLSCSEDSSLCHWNATNMRTDSSVQTEKDSASCNWLSTNSKNFQVNNLTPQSSKPINSLDVLGSFVACGTDNELVFIANDVKFY